MNKGKEKRSSILTKITVGAAIGAATLFFLKTEKPTLKNKKAQAVEASDDELFI